MLSAYKRPTMSIQEGAQTKKEIKSTGRKKKTNR
jgi:hypothetical protein